MLLQCFEGPLARKRGKNGASPYLTLRMTYSQNVIIYSTKKGFVIPFLLISQCFAFNKNFKKFLIKV